MFKSREQRVYIAIKVIGRKAGTGSAVNPKGEVLVRRTRLYLLRLSHPGFPAHPLSRPHIALSKINPYQQFDP